MMQPRVVLLPAPFGPRRPKNSPASTVNEMPRTASTGGRLALARIGLDQVFDDEDGSWEVAESRPPDPTTRRRDSGEATPSRTTTRPSFTTRRIGGHADPDEVEEPLRAQHDEVGPLPHLEAAHLVRGRPSE